MDIADRGFVYQLSEAPQCADWLEVVRWIIKALESENPYNNRFFVASKEWNPEPVKEQTKEASFKY